MPAKQMTAEEQAAKDAKAAEVYKTKRAQHEKFPLKFALHEFGPELAKLVSDKLTVVSDTRPFFINDKNTRVCTLAPKFFAPLVADSDVPVEELHLRSFTVSETDDLKALVIKLPADKLAVLQKLSMFRSLEETGGAVDLAQGRTPTINVGDDDDAYTCTETAVRYLAAYLNNDLLPNKRRIQDRDVHVDVKVDGAVQKLPASWVLFITVFFGIDIDMLNLPELGGESLAGDVVLNDPRPLLWKANVRDKLFVVHTHDMWDAESAKDKFAIYYTCGTSGIRLPGDRYTDIGQRVLEQAGRELVLCWIWLTETLVGADAVPAAATAYVEERGGGDALYKSEFTEKVLCPLAEKTIVAEWPSIVGTVYPEVNTKRVLADYEADLKEKLSADLPFGNPSSEFLVSWSDGADGRIENFAPMLLSNDKLGDRFSLRLRAAKASHLDGVASDGSAVWGAEGFKQAMAMVNPVLKALAFLAAGQEAPPPAAIALYDPEAAAAAKKKRGKKRAAPEPEAVAPPPPPVFELTDEVAEALRAIVREEVIATTKRPFKLFKTLLGEIHEQTKLRGDDIADDDEDGEETN